MKSTSTPHILNPEYLLKELVALLSNDPESAPRFIENLINIDYDLSDKDAYYKLLSPEQRAWLHKIHLQRKADKDFDLQFQKILFTAGGMVGLGFVVANLID